MDAARVKGGFCNVTVRTTMFCGFQERHLTIKHRTRDMMTKLKLTVNEQKTRRCHLPEDTFTFLGYTFGRQYSIRTGRSYLGPKPALKKIRKLCREISVVTASPSCW